MLLPLSVAAGMATGLLWGLALPRLRGSLPRLADELAARHRARHAIEQHGYDPGRELRAEQRARELLRSCVNEEEWAMYRDLGFLRVWAPTQAPYAYLVYPHKPMVSYVPQTGPLLNEYCVAFPDETRPYGSARLPDADDVLAKWMALTGDEQRLISTANMHLPGRQLDPTRVKRDLWRLSQWERARMRDAARVAGKPGKDDGPSPGPTPRIDAAG